MNFISLALLAIDLVALGGAATVVLTRWVPPSLAERAAQHGRFTGLDAAVPDSRAGSYRPHAQTGALNGRTSN